MSSLSKVIVERVLDENGIPETHVALSEGMGIVECLGMLELAKDVALRTMRAPIEEQE